MSNPRKPETELEELAQADDTVIGRAFKISAAVLVVIVIAVAITLVVARRKPAPGPTQMTTIPTWVKR